MLPPTSGHCQCDTHLIVIIPAVQDHTVVQSQGRIHAMIDYFTQVTLVNYNNCLYLESTWYRHTYKIARILSPEIWRRSQSLTAFYVQALINANSNSITIPNQYFTATRQWWEPNVNLMERLSTEQPKFSDRDSWVRSVKSYRCGKTHVNSVWRDTHQEVDSEVHPEINDDYTKATRQEHTDGVAYWEHTNVVDRIHQQKTFPCGRTGCVRVDALRQSRQRHPGGGILGARRQYHALSCISPSDRRFAVSSRSVGLLF